jgi:hypothetical protein
VQSPERITLPPRPRVQTRKREPSVSKYPRQCSVSDS